MHPEQEPIDPVLCVERQRSGLCWFCEKPKENPFGLCGHCGRFGMAENEIERRSNKHADDIS
ncbi:MAG: hypothetical protein Q8Q39_05255 [bacterium]|nr:hypothetical protein [bacterium]